MLELALPWSTNPHLIGLRLELIGVICHRRFFGRWQCTIFMCDRSYDLPQGSLNGRKVLVPLDYSSELELKDIQSVEICYALVTC